MLWRFSLYGFLKNQTYYEPFILLIFLEKGLSFFQVGILIGFREICINLFEIPSGALADLFGRRKTMILSFISYIFSFIVFSWSSVFWQLFIAMFFFAIGDAFRTGTHKAMIFDWLKSQGREKEKTKVYGFTRSWSNLGSALSVIIAAIIVIFSNNYNKIFLYSIIPYFIGIINFMSYPKFLDGEIEEKVSFKRILIHLYESFLLAIKNKNIRKLMIEAMGFQGLFKSIKDYIQPILKQTAIALPIFLFLSQKSRTSILIALVYFFIHILSSIASRSSYILCEKMGNEEKASKLLWHIYFIIFLCLIPSLYYKLNIISIFLFTIITIIDNFWRPTLVSRFNNYSPSKMGATILSIESQSKSISVMFLAPLTGYLIDNIGFSSIGIIGSIISIFIILFCFKTK